MCIFLLQTRPTPVLPRLQQLAPTFRRTVGQWTCEFCDDVREAGSAACPVVSECLRLGAGLCRLVQVRACGLDDPTASHTHRQPTPPPTQPQIDSLRGFGRANGESLAQLLWAFFEYWAWRHNYSHDVVSVRWAGGRVAVASV